MHWLQALHQNDSISAHFRPSYSKTTDIFVQMLQANIWRKGFVFCRRPLQCRRKEHEHFFLCEIGKRNRYVRLIDHGRMRAPTALESGNNAQHVFSFSDRSCWELIITTTSHGTSRFVSERRFGMGCPSHLQHLFAVLCLFSLS